MRRVASEMTANGAGPHVVRLAMHVARSVFDVALEAGAIKANPVAVSASPSRSSISEQMWTLCGLAQVAKRPSTR